jgi:long-chain acyl-CoA synthetase
VKLFENEDCCAFVGDKPISYKDFYNSVQESINLLKSYGITRGDKVAILSENMPNWGIAYFSITYFGAVVVPILSDFHTSDVHRILKHSEAKAVFVSDKHLATIEDFDEKNIVINLNTLSIIDNLTNKNYIDAIKTKVSMYDKDYKLQEDDLASIIYTSGTTGNSKGVMLSHKNLVTNALSFYEKIDVNASDVFLSILPMAHTLECTVGFTIPLLHGASIYYIDKSPTPSVLLKAFKVVRPTLMITVPLIIEKIYKNKILPSFTSSFFIRNFYKVEFFRKKLNKLAGKKLLESFGGKMRAFGIGGAGLSPFVEKFLIESEFPYIVGYGLTETAPLLTSSIMGGVIKYKSVGTAMVGVELAIKNKDFQGEIIAKSPSLMMGYYKNKEQTEETMENGWFLTGDLGYIDEDGFLFISGRSKNVIISSSGENIYPEQIEAIINQNKVVLDSLVMQQNEKLVARVHLDYEHLDDILKEHKISSSVELLEILRLDINSKISSFSRMIKFIEQIEPFVKTPTKKIKRYLYKE